MAALDLAVRNVEQFDRPGVGALISSKSTTAAEVVAEFLERMRVAADPAKATMFKGGLVFEPDSARRAFWTHVMINALLQMGKERGFTTYPSNYYLGASRRGQYHNSRYSHAGSDESEFMIDVVWGHWGETIGRWRESRDSGMRMGISLASESEWGWLEGRNEENHLEATFNDFSKLVAIKSPVKVFICNSSGPAMTRELFESRRPWLGTRSTRLVRSTLSWYGTPRQAGDCIGPYRRRACSKSIEPNDRYLGPTRPALTSYSRGP